MNVGLPANTGAVLRRYRLPSGGFKAYVDYDSDEEHGAGASEITASVLLAQTEAGLLECGDAGEAVANLVSNQRQEGGWNAFWWKDDLFCTHRVVKALSAISRDDRLTTHGTGATARIAADAVRGAGPSISAGTIDSTPFLLGLWLSSWVSVSGNVNYLSIKRMLHQLQLQQCRDGRWLSVPIKRIGTTKLRRPWGRNDSGKLYADGHCLVTTATVLGGLSALHKALVAAQRLP
jgi:hypothetical protein